MDKWPSKFYAGEYVAFSPEKWYNYFLLMIRMYKYKLINHDKSCFNDYSKMYGYISF